MLILITLAVMVSLTGCFRLSGDDLLLLPKQPQDSVQLQVQIDKQLSMGAQLISPVSGANRQAIQKADVDGDGQEEAIAFYRQQGEKPLRIVFYRKGEGYEPFAHIEGDGETVDSITYVDIDGDQVTEIVVGWRVGVGALKALTVYQYNNDQMELMLTDSYSGFALMDLNEDEKTELITVRHDAATLTGVAAMYGMTGIEMELLSQADLSLGIDQLTRIKTGLLADGHRGLFVTGRYDTSAAITDIFAAPGGKLTNITLNPKNGVSDSTVRRFTTPVVTDISGDGTLEVPAPEEMPYYDPAQEGTETPWMKINWQGYNILGNSSTEMITYHNYTDSWFFDIPEAWSDGLTMTIRDISPSERGRVFAVWREDETEPHDLLVVYTLTGDNREEQAKENNRIVLLRHADMIVAAELIPQFSSKYQISESELVGRFYWIQWEWITGELNLN